MNEFEKFVARAISKYGSKYDYSKFVYTSQRDEGIIICPIHGEFKQSPRKHLDSKYGCDECKKVFELQQRSEQFFSQAKQRYNNYYDYSKFIYTDAKTKSIIVCPVHGDFLQSPDKHLQGVNPCPMCEQESKCERSKHKSEDTRRKISEGKLKSADDFIVKATEKFGDKFEYDFTNFSGMVGNKIRIKCPIHGWFEKVPRVFLISSCGCTECGLRSRDASKTKSYDSFLEEALIKHNRKYSYPESNRSTFKNRDIIVDIECPIHGIFKKRAMKHLSGQGCFECKKEELVRNGILVGGYNSELFSSNKQVADKEAHLYYLSVLHGKYYKVGISVNLNRRLGSLKSMFGHVELIKSRTGRLEDMYEIEQNLLSLFANKRVFTKLSTELFSEDVSKYSDFDLLFFEKGDNYGKL